MSEFAFNKAVRSRVPLLVGFVGPSGTGKTFSALRVARGIQRVTGGRVKVIDTEHGRALHYCDEFDFDHCDFKAPFSAARYLEAIREAARTPGPVVVDSLSHEHDGPGGYLDFHEQEVERLCKPRNQGGGGFSSAYTAQVPAWAQPAAERRKLVQGIIHMGATCLFCFRAKEKVDMNAKRPDGSKTVGNLGWMPIAGDSFVYEMTLKCLLLPGADGVPTWHPEEAGERQMCKLPRQFRGIFKEPRQLDEDTGEALARWAAGTSAPDPLDDLIGRLTACERAAFDGLRAEGRGMFKRLRPDDQERLKVAIAATESRLNDLDAARPDALFGEPATNLPG